MHKYGTRFPRRAAGWLLGALFAGAALTAAADMPQERFHHGMGRPPSAEEMRAHLHRHLEKMAGRLEIKASQQGAWAAYAQAIEGMAPPRHDPPPPDADAATLTRQHAERAADMAQRLATIADATASLSKALDPDQRKTLDQIVREHGMRMHAHRHHGHDMMGPPGGPHGRADAGPDGGPDGSPAAIAERAPEDD